MAHHRSTSSYSLGSVGVAGVVSAPSDGLLELVVSDDDVVSLSGVASGAISFSASAIYDQQEKIQNQIINQFLLGNEFSTYPFKFNSAIV